MKKTPVNGSSKTRIVSFRKTNVKSAMMIWNTLIARLYTTKAEMHATHESFLFAQNDLDIPVPRKSYSMWSRGETESFKLNFDTSANDIRLKELCK